MKKIFIISLLLVFSLYAVTLNRKQFSNFLSSNNVILLTPLSVSSVTLPDDLGNVDILKILRSIGYSYSVKGSYIYAYKGASIYLNYCFPHKFPFHQVCSVYFYDSNRCSLTCSPKNLDFLLTFVANNKQYSWGYGSVTFVIKK